MPRLRKLLFVDTNILLDFYRTRTEAGISLLKHLDQIASQIIVTYQLEMEFKKNRQTALKEGIDELKSPPTISRPGLFSDAVAVRAMQRAQKESDSRVKKLKQRLMRALQDPASYDPVYQVCQRIFHKHDSLVLSRDDVVRHSVRRRALKRFFLGCPPRKKNDTSIGDAMNWEWMVECAKNENAELVICTRDSDYGVAIDGRAYVNDHLRQEFSERVSRRRKLLLYPKLSEALSHFEVEITEAELQEEVAIAAHKQTRTENGPVVLSDLLKEWFEKAGGVADIEKGSAS